MARATAAKAGGTATKAKASGAGAAGKAKAGGKGAAGAATAAKGKARAAKGTTAKGKAAAGKASGKSAAGKALRGRQTPTFSTVPRVRKTDGPMAAQLAGRFFVEPLEWQCHVLNALLARNAQDKYRFHAFALSVPRQNGKSELVRARCFYGLVTTGERILYTCQHGDTADEMFKLMSEPFEAAEEDDQDPDALALRKLLECVRKANGQQAIYLNNGGYIRFTTRTNSMGRGRSFDVLIYDEAQELTGGQQAASLPTISAGRQRNPQTIYLGTPPGPECAGDVFRVLHDAAHKGETSTPWMEWAVEHVGDVTDRSRWEATNPSIGITVTEMAVEGELAMAPATFARERLGWWDGAAVEQAAIDADDWRACGVADAPADGTMSIGVKYEPTGRRVCVAGCMRREGAPDYIELLFDESTKRGVKWLAGWLMERKDKIAGLAIDGKAGSGDLVQRLEDARFPRAAIVKTGTAAVADAAAMLVNAVGAGDMCHWRVEGQSGLDDSALKSPRRKIGDGFGFGGDDAAPIEAASLALYAARTTKRNPARKGAVA